MAATTTSSPPLLLLLLLLLVLGSAMATSLSAPTPRRTVRRPQTRTSGARRPQPQRRADTRAGVRERVRERRGRDTQATRAAVEEAVAMTRALVDIDSVSGNEKAAGDYVAALLAAENYTVERQVLVPGQRENILAYKGNASRTGRLLINR